MAKRFRDENSAVILNGFGQNTKSNEIYSLFSRFGRIEGIKFLGRRQCLVQFDNCQSPVEALKLNNTKQPSLSTTALAVTLPSVDKIVKKSRQSQGFFVAIAPPRFNNFLIPVLPSFFSS
jgi:hypothetical protein